jgi:lysine 6-dehydrogenase
LTLENIVVVGLGNIGLRTLKRLSDLGYNAVGIDSSLSSIQRAGAVGLKAVIGDASNPSALEEALGFKPDIVVTALPGSVAYRIVEKLVKHGYNVVDVSFFPEDPRNLERLASDNKSTVVVDAGIAPGYSNYLVGKAFRLVKAGKAYIYVGGLSKDPSPPLNIAATWSTYDLLEEYVRPARMVSNGRIISVNPLEADVSIFEFPGVGRLEAFPTDGLRSLIYSYMGFMKELVEYTLRRPGHLDFMRSLARIGFLSDQPVKMTGCTVSPRECLAKIIERAVSGLEDIVVLSVEAEGEDGIYRADLLVEPRGGWSAMAIATSGFQVAVTRLLAEEKIPTGLVYPEKLGEDEELSGHLEGFLAREGIKASEKLE